MGIIKYKIYTLGCKVNQYDSNILARKLVAHGLEQVKNQADLAIINSCAVTKTAIRKNKNMISKAKAENPKAKVLLIGCWPKVYRQGIKGLNVNFIWVDKEPGEIAVKIKHIFKIIKSSNRQKNNKIKFNPNKSKYFLKIQDGCNQYCSYCIIPYARGELRSKNVQSVLDEVHDTIAAGYKEIVLCGIHLGLYGADLLDKTNLAELLKKLIKIKNLGRIRLSSIEVTEVGNELINLMFYSRKICRYLHMPLQSGSDKILSLMNRPYNKKYYRNKIIKIRKLIPDIAITTDIIVGFPGENEKDFKDTCKFVKEIKFSRLHVFPFSAHEKTPAAKLADRIADKIIKKRAEALRIIGKKLEDNYKRKFIGKLLAVVVEKQAENKITGKTEFYFDIDKIINKIENARGRIIKVKY